MSSSLQDSYDAGFARLSAREQALEAKARDMDARLSGLKDIDVLLSLIETKLSLALLMMGRAAGFGAAGNAPALEEPGHERLETGIRDKALSAFGLLEGLLSEDISEDQKNAVSEDPRFAPVKEKIEEFILKGGGGFLHAEIESKAATRLSRMIVTSVRKYMTDDDKYPPLDLDNLPEAVRSFLLTFFPDLVSENPQQPPYGIEEGEEETYSSEVLKLPLSQAVFYLETELIPELEKKLAESPGDGSIQKEIADLRKSTEEYKKMRFFPRSVPIFPEKGYYSDGITTYTDDGEMLVPIPLPATIRSGTNLDRKMELVRMDLVRRAAGKGICPELDREYRRLQSLESGMRGSSRQASAKLDVGWGFRVLKKDQPVLRRLEDKEGFKELERIAAGGNPGDAARRVAALLKADQDRGELPPVIGISRSDPS
jgi:hypothetical protein